VSLDRLLMTSREDIPTIEDENAYYLTDWWAVF